MRSLTTTLKTLHARLGGNSPRPDWRARAGFAAVAPDLPVSYRVRHVADQITIGVDARGRGVSVPFDHALIAGDPKTGVTSTVRLFALHAARFPGTRLHIYDDTGEWPVANLIAHRFVTRVWGIADGLSDDTAAAQVLADLEALHAEMQRRNHLLRGLVADLAAAGGPRVRSLADVADLDADQLAAAGIDPARTDPETAGLHRHVVVMPGVDWWLSHPVHGAQITEQLFWLAGRGRDVGVQLVLGSRTAAPGVQASLYVVPAALRDRIPTRIALPMRAAAHTDAALGTTTRPAGAVEGTSVQLLALVRATFPGAAMIGQVQLFRCTPSRLYRGIGWLRHDREHDGWLTGDALVLHEEMAANRDGEGGR